MAIDVARRPRRRGSRAGASIGTPEPTIAPASTIAIGEFDQTVFDCPVCSRPLALGARRCPGCQTRLLNGVPLAKASIFIAAGLAIGLLTGAGGGLLFGLGHTTGAAAAGAVGGPGATPVAGSHGGAGGSVAPNASFGATATATPRPTSTADSGIPPVTRSALVQVVGTNGRLSVSGAGLRAVLAKSPFDASAVAQILRSISADTVYGVQLADRITDWTATGALGGRLMTYYGAIRDTAVTALDASVRNAPVYKAAAKDMLQLLDEMAAIDDAVRDAAGSAGIALPGPSSAPTAP